MDLNKQMRTLEELSFNGQITITDFREKVQKFAKTYHALQLHKTPVSGSFTTEQLQEYTNEKIFKYLVVNYGLKLTYQEWIDKNYR